MFRDFFKAYRPNPFRFIRPRLYKWIYPINCLHNALHLRFLIGIHHVNMSKAAIANLALIKKTPGHHLIVSNHASFMDPPLLFDAFRRSGIRPFWIAGHDVMYGMGGFREWYMSAVGAMSLDRGVMDRRSLAYAQQIIDGADNALLIFPEGEADYCNAMLRPFYAGACLFALNAALKKDTTLPINLFPIFLHYPFLSSPKKSLQKYCTQYLQDINQFYPGTLAKIELESTPSAAQLTTLLTISLTALGIENPEQSDFSNQFLTLARARLTHLYTTYLPETTIDTQTCFDDFQTVMILKNRMSSHLLRLQNAPEITEIIAAQEELKNIQDSLYSLYDLHRLSKLEEQYLGLNYPDDKLSLRISRLTDMFNLMMPYSIERHNATEMKLAQWTEHQLDCRRVKIFYLLSQDIDRLGLEKNNALITWEDFDEVLTKLEIGLLAKFRFREPRRLDIQTAPPIDVKLFVEQHPQLKRKALLEALTHQCFESINTMLRNNYT